MPPSTVATAIRTQPEFAVRVASSGQLVTAIGVNRNMPLRPADRFRAWVAAQKRRHAGVEGKQRQRKILGFMRSGRQQGIEMVSMRQQITPLCFAS